MGGGEGGIWGGAPTSLPVTSAYFHISPIAVTHSTTLLTWMAQVGRDSALVGSSAMASAGSAWAAKQSSAATAAAEAAAGRAALGGAGGALMAAGEGRDWPCWPCCDGRAHGEVGPPRWPGRRVQAGALALATHGAARPCAALDDAAGEVEARIAPAMVPQKAGPEDYSQFSTTY